MKHQFFGGPLGGIIADLETLLASDVTLEIPWEDYQSIATAYDADGNKTFIQWKYRAEHVEIMPPNADVVVEHQVHRAAGGYDVLKMVKSSQSTGATPAMTLPSTEDLSDEQKAQITAIEARFDVSYAPKLAVDDPEIRSDEPSSAPRLIQQPVVYGSSEDPWSNFEKRRKSIKLPRGKFGTICGLSTSFGWRLESGNVSASDAKKLGFDSIDEVYAMADAKLTELGA